MPGGRSIAPVPSVSWSLHAAAPLAAAAAAGRLGGRRGGDQHEPRQQQCSAPAQPRTPLVLAVGGGAGRGGPQQRRVLRIHQGAPEHCQARQPVNIIKSILLSIKYY